MKTKLKYIGMLALVVGMSSQTFAVTKAGDAPKGTVKTTPDVDYMGVGMKMDLSATDLEDKDCKDGEEAADSIDASSGVKFEVSAGSLSSSTSATPKLTLPTTAGDVTITLKVDDKGDVHNDGGFVTGGTKTIKVRKPATIEMVANTASSTTDGGKVTMLVKDESGDPFKVTSARLLESKSSLRYYLKKDNEANYATIFLTPSSTSNVDIGALDSAGKYVDNFKLHGTDSIAANSGAVSKCEISLNLNQTYSIKLDQQSPIALASVEGGDYTRRVVYTVNKSGANWATASNPGFDP